MFNRKGIIIGVAIVIAGALWFFFSSSGGSQGSITTTETDDASGPGAQILQSLLSLQAISLNTAIFSDPAFATLQDLTTAIVSEPVGRTDPFAPISGGAAVSVQSNAGASIFNSK